MSMKAALISLFVTAAVVFEGTSVVAAWTQCDEVGRQMQYFATRMSWESAERRCQTAGGHLVTVQSAADRLCAVHAIEEAGDCIPAQCGRIWVGLNSMNTNNTWHWLASQNGRQDVIVGKGIWAVEQPDNPGSQRCANWAPNRGISDDYCVFAESFLCERTVPDRVVTAQCNGREWSYHALAFNPTEASEYCIQRGGFLAPPDRSCVNRIFKSPDLETAQDLLTWVSCATIFGPDNRECSVLPEKGVSLVVVNETELLLPKPFLCTAQSGAGPSPPTSSEPPMNNTVSIGTELPPQTTSNRGSANLGVVVACGLLGACIALLLAGVIMYQRRKLRSSRIFCRQMEVNSKYVTSSGPVAPPEEPATLNEAQRPTPTGKAQRPATLARFERPKSAPMRTQRASSVCTTRCSRKQVNVTFQVHKERTKTIRTTTSICDSCNSLHNPYATSPLSCVLRRSEMSQAYAVATATPAVPPNTERPQKNTLPEYAEPLCSNPAYGPQFSTALHVDAGNEYSYDKTVDGYDLPQ